MPRLGKPSGNAGNVRLGWWIQVVDATLQSWSIEGMSALPLKADMLSLKIDVS